MSLGKILAGFVVGTVQVVGRAFAQAYREAAAGTAMMDALQSIASCI
jgi:1,4-dihydroxy-2-naphthoate octaprenyltransferase